MSARSDELVREVTRDGNRVALLRCYPDAGFTLVEAEVLPAGESEPVRRGPHAFATAPEALRFVNETLLALQYLGCRVEA